MAEILCKMQRSGKTEKTEIPKTFFTILYTDANTDDILCFVRRPLKKTMTDHVMT